MSFVSSLSRRAFGRVVASGTRAGVSARSARAWSSWLRAASIAAMAAGSTVAQPWLPGRPATAAAAEMSSVSAVSASASRYFAALTAAVASSWRGRHQPGGVVGLSA